MPSISAIDEKTGRKFYLDDPDDLRPDEAVIFLLNLHGGGSVGAWQKAFFPANDYKEAYRLVVATPSAATKEPSRRWIGSADDEHLRNIVEHVFAKYGRERVKSFWLVGHSQGGMTSNRLLKQDFFKDRVDGWLCIGGPRIGAVERPESFFTPIRPPNAPLMPASPEADDEAVFDPDISFIFTVGEHEVVTMPETSPWAEKYGAGPRQRLPDIVDTQAGQIHDTTREGRSTPAWGLDPRPGRTEVWVYPDARDRRVIADLVRIDKGHTEGLEPRLTEFLVKMISEAPGGKARAAA